MKELQEVINAAVDNYNKNKASGSPAESLAYDSGRIAGLKEAFTALFN